MNKNCNECFENKTNCAVAFIEWEDSRRPDPEWKFIGDILKERPQVVNCFSVGFLLHEGDETLVLAQNIGDVRNCSQASGVILIPRRSIVKITLLD